MFIGAFVLLEGSFFICTKKLKSGMIKISAEILKKNDFVSVF